MGQENAMTRLVLLVAITTGLTVGLHQLGNISGLGINWSDPVVWFGDAAPEDAVGATLRTVGLIIGYWITISTSLYFGAARRSQIRRPRLVTVVTLPSIRRVVDRALATALAASIAVSPISPALAEQTPPPPVVFDITTDGIPVPHVHMNEDLQEEQAQDDATTEGAEEEASEPRPSPMVFPVATSSPSVPLADGYTVESGDNLWKIADRIVESLTDGVPTTSAVTSYWRSVVNANQGTLRSGDPNLIFPGEIIVLPALEATP